MAGNWHISERMHYLSCLSLPTVVPVSRSANSIHPAPTFKLCLTLTNVKSVVTDLLWIAFYSTSLLWALKVRFIEAVFPPLYTHSYSTLFLAFKQFLSHTDSRTDGCIESNLEGAMDQIADLPVGGQPASSPEPQALTADCSVLGFWPPELKYCRRKQSFLKRWS